MRVVTIDRVVVATDDLGRTSGTLSDRLDIGFGEILELTTTDGDCLRSVIDDSGIGIDVIQSASDNNDAVSTFVDEHGTGLYALALQVADLAEARADLADDGIEPVGEISAGTFTEYLYHPHDFDGLFVFLAKSPRAYETNKRLEALREHS